MAKPKRPPPAPKSDVRAVCIEGRRIVWCGLLEVVVDDSVAALAWKREPLATARWDGRCLVDFRTLNRSHPSDFPGVRHELEAVEAALRLPSASHASPPATWSMLDEVGARLLGAVAASPLPPLLAALAALATTTPIAAVLAALEPPLGGGDPFVAAVLAAVMSDIEAAVAMPWLRPLPAGTAKPQRIRVGPPKPRGPYKPHRPRPLRIRHKETVY